MNPYQSPQTQTLSAVEFSVDNTDLIVCLALDALALLSVTTLLWIIT